MPFVAGDLFPFFTNDLSSFIGILCLNCICELHSFSYIGISVVVVNDSDLKNAFAAPQLSGITFDLKFGFRCHN
jgi:hypothetical protein